MRKVFVALAFIAIIVSATMLPDLKQRVVDSLSKIQKTRMGKNILTAIQLELSSKNKDNVVARIIELLNQLLNEQSTQHTQAVDNLASKEAYCNESRNSFENQIQSKRSDIATAESHIPVLQSEVESDEVQKADQERILSDSQVSLQNAHDDNEIAVAAFNKSISNHNIMIEALTQARALIAQLQNTSFLQKNTKILAQITAHHNKSMKALENHASKGIFSILMQMAQDVGTQSDQGLVKTVVDVFDDLLQHETEGVQSETDAENNRVNEYNARVVYLQSEINNATSEIARLESELVRLSNEIAQDLNDISNWSNQLTELEALLESLNTQCDIDINNLHSLIQELAEQIDVISQVIAIFEGQSISDIKPVVENFAYSEAL